jgi:DNA (cytosine-5)-methyltransferase 1
VLTVGSLFAGIGGFDLGLERAGMRSVWQCEIDPYCQRVLAKHWPDVLRVPDIRDVGASTVPYADVICGGFPCQDLSYAGKGAGLDGERSGLWSEYARVIRELRPRYVLVENVAALLARGLHRVLADLAGLGFDAEWTTLRASDFGAPHARDRLWLVAYAEGGDGPRTLLEAGQGWRPSSSARGLSRLAMAPGWQPRGFWGSTEPPTPLLVDGFPGCVAEVEALGNSLVPQIAEWLGHRIIEWEREQMRAAA